MTQLSSSSSAAPIRRGETSGLWMIKIFTGPLLVLLLIVHFTVNHMIAESGLLSWNDVIRYFDNPLVPLMEIVFLATVITHSLLGLRSMDIQARRWRRWGSSGPTRPTSRCT